MAQKTAVEWLADKLMKGEFINSPDELITQAKQMEKEQIVNAYDAGLFDGTMDDVNDRIYKKYYNETYQ